MDLWIYYADLNEVWWTEFESRGRVLAYLSRKITNLFWDRLEQILQGRILGNQLVPTSKWRMYVDWHVEYYILTGFKNRPLIITYLIITVEFFL